MNKLSKETHRTLIYLAIGIGAGFLLKTILARRVPKSAETDTKFSRNLAYTRPAGPNLSGKAETDTKFSRNLAGLGWLATPMVPRQAPAVVAQQAPRVPFSTPPPRPVVAAQARAVRAPAAPAVPVTDGYFIEQ